MIVVEDLWEEVKKTSGICDEPKILRFLSDAVSLIVNKIDIDGQVGTLDICTTGGGSCISLPREVDVVLAVNICGQPALGLDRLFQFHLNANGACGQSCSWTWEDQGGSHPVYRDISTPSKLVAYVSRPEDSGKSLIVYGFDDKGNPLDTITSQGRTAGHTVATVYGYSIPETTAPVVARITAVVKEETIGSIRLSTIDSSGPTGVLLAVYEPQETRPAYRRIKINRRGDWVRVFYKRSSPVLTSRSDHIFLRSRIAIQLAMKAIKSYSESDVATAHAFEADAVRLEFESQQAATPQLFFPIQVIDGNNLVDRSDYDIR